MTRELGIPHICSRQKIEVKKKNKQTKMKNYKKPHLVHPTSSYIFNIFINIEAKMTQIPQTPH